MARIRTIKPEFWADQLVASWPVYTRLAYIALWNEADDDGRLRADPSYLHGRCFPYEPHLNMGEILAPIVADNRLVVWRVGVETYGHLPNFNKHQSISKPSKSRLPTPPGILPESSRRTTRALPAPSRRAPRGIREGKGSGIRDQGREGIGDADFVEQLSLPATTSSPSDLQAAWNRHSPPLPRWMETNRQRHRTAQLRLAEHTIEEWEAVISRIAASSFCRGQNDRAWRANPDFLLRPGTYAKVVEGNYDDREPAQRTVTTTRARPIEDADADWKAQRLKERADAQR